MTKEHVLGGVGESTPITTITGKAAQTRTFPATIGHRYIIAVDCLTEYELVLDGLDLVANSGLIKTRAYQGVYAGLSVIIGIATKSTVTCAWRVASDAHYNNLIWIDTDAQ